MFYGGVTMPPAIWADWYHLVRALVEHAVSRYGVEEVRDHWAFEVWNGERPESICKCARVHQKIIHGSLTRVCLRNCSAELWGMNFPEPYMTLFNHSSRAVKDVDPRIKIGGPGKPVVCSYNLY
jgi:xylan 1,4-beta-xylosidase